jgi:hypothetical protein
MTMQAIPPRHASFIVRRKPVLVIIVVRQGCAFILRIVIVRLEALVGCAVPHAPESVLGFLDSWIFADKFVSPAELHEALKLLARSDNRDLYRGGPVGELKYDFQETGTRMSRLAQVEHEGVDLGI